MVTWVCGVTEMPCEAPEAQRHGHRKDCPEPFLYKGQCQFECDDGYELEDGGVSLVTCIAKIRSLTVSTEWDNKPTACKGELDSILCHWLHGHPGFSK